MDQIEVETPRLSGEMAARDVHHDIGRQEQWVTDSSDPEGGRTRRNERNVHVHEEQRKTCKSSRHRGGNCQGGTSFNHQ